MDKNKTEQLTFGADEKEILKKMETVESSIGQNIQERNQRELIATKYYSEFVINTKNGPVTLNNVFITAEKDQQGDMSYHFRWIREEENGEQTIEENMIVDKDGKIEDCNAKYFMLNKEEMSKDHFFVCDGENDLPNTEFSLNDQIDRLKLISLLEEDNEKINDGFLKIIDQLTGEYI